MLKHLFISLRYWSEKKGILSYCSRGKTHSNLYWFV